MVKTEIICIIPVKHTGKAAQAQRSELLVLNCGGNTHAATHFTHCIDNQMTAQLVPDTGCRLHMVTHVQFTLLLYPSVR